jgi:tetraacyldisaccharide 4'-kinase
MSIRAAVEKLIHTTNSGLGLSALLLPLTLCSFIYSACMRLRAWLYKTCVFDSFAIPCRVVSVGNITVGGTGKTPTVILLARSLREKSFKVVVVNRGYRGIKTTTPQIVSDGAQVLATCADAGDEAVMLALKLEGIPVISCRDRVAAGILACERFGADIVVLDDGFQHLRLRRDLDIVLVNSADSFGNGRLLPRGILREPLTALGRAGIIVFTKVAAQADLESLMEQIKMLSPDASVFSAAYKSTCFRYTSTGKILLKEHMAGARIAVLCSIGDPASFISMLTHAGMHISDRLLYPDHYGYGSDDYAVIRKVSIRVDAIVTTEKDIAKLDAGMLQLDNLIVMEIEQVIKPDRQFFDDVIKLSGLR